MSTSPPCRAPTRVQSIMSQLRGNTCASPNPVDLLTSERASCSFPVRELTYLLDGGENFTNIKEMVRASVQDQENYVRPLHDLTREQQREASMSKIYDVVQIIRSRSSGAPDDNDVSKPLDEADAANSRAGASKYFEDCFYATLSSLDPSWAIRLGVHFGLFLGVMNAQANSEQKKIYIADIQSMRIIGCFAMTELGHGSHTQGIETTATFDVAAQHFMLHTPSLTATKWWIGMAGQTATHAAVYARLIIKGKDHGVQVFIVPIRHSETGLPLPGVDIGDMGKKMGRDGLDNGWLRFNNVVVPKANHLSKWSRVEHDGTFVAPPTQAVTYQTLVATRAELFGLCSETMKKAVTIAVRYSAARTQFLKDNNKPELGEQQLLNYQTQQQRIFPLLALCYALHFTSAHTSQLISSGAQHADVALDTLPELHSTTSALKSLGTWMVNDGIEACRLACGGSGYSTYSGLPDLKNDFAVMCTFEGENYVLALQCGKYLVKQAMNVLNGTRPSGVLRYLSDSTAPVPTTPDALSSHSFLLAAYQHRARRKIMSLAKLFAAESAQGISFVDSAERHAVDITELARAHGMLFMIDCFISQVNKAPKPLQDVLGKLASLFGLHHIENTMGDFLEDGYLSGAQASCIRTNARSLLAAIRPDAVSLVDAFNIPDFMINSPLGRYDGNVYEELFKLVKNAPGCQGVPSYFNQYIKPLTTRQPQA